MQKQQKNVPRPLQVNCTLTAPTFLSHPQEWSDHPAEAHDSLSRCCQSNLAIHHLWPLWPLVALVALVAP